MRLYPHQEKEMVGNVGNKTIHIYNNRIGDVVVICKMDGHIFLDIFVVSYTFLCLFSFSKNRIFKEFKKGGKNTNNSLKKLKD